MSGKFQKKFKLLKTILLKLILKQYSQRCPELFTYIDILSANAKKSPHILRYYNLFVKKKH